MGLRPFPGLGEGGLDLGAQARLVGLDREQPVGALGGDRAGDVGIGGDGVDGDERALQPVLGAEPLEQRRDGGELARLVGHRLLGEHQAGGGGEGGDEVQRARARAPVVAAARGLAVDRDETGLLRPALAHPGGEGGGEERGVDPVHQDGEPALAGHAVRVGQVPAEEIEMRRAPGGDVLVVVAVGDGAADDEQQHLRAADAGCAARRAGPRPRRSDRAAPRGATSGAGSRRTGSWAAPIQGRRIDSEKTAPCHLSYEFGALGT